MTGRGPRKPSCRVFAALARRNATWNWHGQWLQVADHASEPPSRWAAVTSIAAKIGCTPQTLHDWVGKAGVDSGQRAGVPTDMAEKLKALERENRELRAGQ